MKGIDLTPCASPARYNAPHHNSHYGEADLDLSAYDADNSHMDLDDNEFDEGDGHFGDESHLQVFRIVSILMLWTLIG